MLKINEVENNSIAKELKIKSGDYLVGFDGYEYNDILDLVFYEAQESFVMNIKKADGRLIDFEIEKDFDERLGLIIAEEIHTKQCINNCVFCFVDQLPTDKKLRPSLKLKDDDWRMSAIYGNFVTLTNVSEAELQRIQRQKISPLYVSVHTVDKALRQKMLGTDVNIDILPILKRLKEADIKIHSQIVLCEGMNDGQYLIDSIQALEPLCQTLAVVPVGLTKYKNPEILPISAQGAGCAIDHIEYFQSKYLLSSGRRFCFASDEMYLIAGRKIPDYSQYEKFEQIENGVGMIAKFEFEVDQRLAQIDKANAKQQKLAVATGVAASGFIKKTVQKIVERTNITVDVFAIKNKFFGEEVTVAGLVCGSDIAEQLKDLHSYDALLIAKNMLKEFDTLFLDNTDIAQLGRTLKTKIIIVDNDGAEFVDTILSSGSE